MKQREINFAKIKVHPSPQFSLFALELDSLKIQCYLHIFLHILIMGEVWAFQRHVKSDMNSTEDDFARKLKKERKNIMAKLYFEVR